MTESMQSSYGGPVDVNRKVFRESNRHGVVVAAREPLGRFKIEGPRMGLPGWIHGHQTTVTPGVWIPSVGLERRMMGLGGGSSFGRPVRETVARPLTSVGGRASNSPGTGGKGKGRRRRKAEQLAEVHAAQDASLAKAIKRKAAHDKLARDRELSSLVAMSLKMKSGETATLLTNPAFQVVTS